MMIRTSVGQVAPEIIIKKTELLIGDRKEINVRRQKEYTNRAISINRSRK
jgi:hypothetical protein